MTRATGGTVPKGAAASLAGWLRPDLLLIADLKQALRQPGCPICRLLRDADRYYLKVFLREGKDDGRMLLRLLGSWGLCARHASDLVRLEPVERGDGLGTGTLYDWLLDQARRLLDDLRPDLSMEDGAGPPRWRRRQSPRRRAERVLRRLDRKTPCPPCEAQQQCEAYVVQEFVRALEPTAGLPPIREMYLASEGLCLPHWQTIHRLRSSPSVSALIEEKQREAVASLKAALDADLDRGVVEEVYQGGPNQEPAYARALAAAASDTTWQPLEKS